MTVLAPSSLFWTLVSSLRVQSLNSQRDGARLEVAILVSDVAFGLLCPGQKMKCRVEWQGMENGKWSAWKVERGLEGAVGCGKQRVGEWSVESGKDSTVKGGGVECGG